MTLNRRIVAAASATERYRDDRDCNAHAKNDRPPLARKAAGMGGTQFAIPFKMPVPCGLQGTGSGTRKEIGGSGIVHAESQVGIGNADACGHHTRHGYILVDLEAWLVTEEDVT